MKKKQLSRYRQQLHSDLRGYQERDGGDHRRDILLEASRLTDKSYLAFLVNEFGLSHADLTESLRSAEEGQG
jgi:hypothetical protein